jgi:hypothetical protein
MSRKRKPNSRRPGATTTRWHYVEVAEQALELLGRYGEAHCMCVEYPNALIDELQKLADDADVELFNQATPSGNVIAIAISPSEDARRYQTWSMLARRRTIMDDAPKWGRAYDRPEVTLWVDIEDPHGHVEHVEGGGFSDDTVERRCSSPWPCATSWRPSTKGLTDEQMMAINQVVRSAIATGLHVLDPGQRQPELLHWRDFTWSQIPDYWERPKPIAGPDADHELLGWDHAGGLKDPDFGRSNDTDA